MLPDDPGRQLVADTAVAPPTDVAYATLQNLTRIVEITVFHTRNAVLGDTPCAKDRI